MLIFKENKINFKIYNNDSGAPKGGIKKNIWKCSIVCFYTILVGYGKNQAVGISNGIYLCFQDIVSMHCDVIAIYFTQFFFRMM